MTHPLMLCRVCRRPLNEVVDLDDGTVLRWEHSTVLMLGPAHVPDPIPADLVANEAVAVCDFCSQQAPVWTYPASTFTMSNEPFGSSGDWAACDGCHDLIEAALWDTLAERGAATVQGRLPRKVRRTVVGHLLKLHQRFVEARTGPSYRH